MRLRLTPVFDSYWWLASERQAIYFRRLQEAVGPWTSDAILSRYKFTNVYRVLDRVTQYLIREVQYRLDRPDSAPELFFRTILFKVFNRIETWQELEHELGPITWKASDLNAVARVLDKLLESNRPIYSAAYIMPSPSFGHTTKHKNHLAMLQRMMRDSVPAKVTKARSLEGVYRELLQCPGIGRFLAYQYSIDLNYSSMLPFDEAAFVVAGPGAVDGISKCFENAGDVAPEEIIYWTTDHQTDEFAKRGLQFKSLFGRSMQPIDCQNMYCEISKYARLAYPSVIGTSGRRRIKQVFRPNAQLLTPPFFPPKWGLTMRPFLQADFQ